MGGDSRDPTAARPCRFDIQPLEQTNEKLWRSQLHYRKDRPYLQASRHVCSAGRAADRCPGLMPLQWYARSARLGPAARIRAKRGPVPGPLTAPARRERPDRPGSRRPARRRAAQLVWRPWLARPGDATRADPRPGRCERASASWAQRAERTMPRLGPGRSQRAGRRGTGRSRAAQCRRAGSGRAGRRGPRRPRAEPGRRDLTSSRAETVSRDRTLILPRNPLVVR
jgi:hypothetical protein